MKRVSDGRTARRTLDLRVARRLWHWIAPHQRLVWLGLLLLLVLSACRLSLPYLVKVAIDAHLVPGRLEGFFGLVAAFLSVAGLEFILRRRQIYTVDLAGQNALYDLRLDLFGCLQRLPARYFDKRPTGALVGRVTTDIEALQELFSTGVVTILGDLIFLTATVVILFWLNARLALVTLAAVPVLLAVTVLIRIRVRAAYDRLRAMLSRMNAFLHEHISGMPVVQMFLRERATAAGFARVNAQVRAAQLRSVRWESSFSAMTEMIGSLTLAMILWYGGGLAARSEGGSPAVSGLTLGTLFAFVDYMQRFFAPLSELSQKYTVMQNAMTAARRIFAVLDEEPEAAGPRRSRTLPPPNGRIEFQGVTFGYDPPEPVLRDLSFTVAPGERVALVGATGAGKTSVLKLLIRLYAPQRGSVLLDGVDVRDYPLKVLRRRVGMVPQEAFLFEGTVLENIRLGHPQITDAEARAAAGRLHLDEMAARLPDGYDEAVQERGKNLSAGEKQLVSFARALAGKPEVLALDEATSSVDSRTEHLLQEAVHQLLAGRSALIVAHRLSTIQDADRILVLHHGRLVEEGTHAALLARRGRYWRLYQLQYRDQEDREPPAQPSGSGFSPPAPGPPARERPGP